MNYLIIQQTGDDPKEPPKVVQMFTDASLIELGNFMHEMLNNHGDKDNAAGCAASTFLQLLQQWEVETQ